MKISKNTLSENSQFMLYNTINYKQTINYSITEILTKFVSVIVEYMRFVSEKMPIKNKSYCQFVFERGVDTLIHIFSFLFYYTKNLELTFYHTQKAYYFYVEFIEQISDDNVNFLKLSSIDATLFVYKKTIFDINNEYKKTMTEPSIDDKKTLALFESYTHIYKRMILFTINHDSFQYSNKINYIHTCCNHIEVISEILNKNKITPIHVQLVYNFSTLLDDSRIEITDFFKLLEEFIKKLTNKKKIDDKNIKNKIYNNETNKFIVNNEFNKIVEWIFID
jgi:hypothetical protein